MAPIRFAGERSIERMSLLGRRRPVLCEDLIADWQEVAKDRSRAWLHQREWLGFGLAQNLDDRSVGVPKLLGELADGKAIRVLPTGAGLGWLISLSFCIQGREKRSTMFGMERCGNKYEFRRIFDMPPEWGVTVFNLTKCLYRQSGKLSALPKKTNSQNTRYIFCRPGTT
jgi:hypothetical protein